MAGATLEFDNKQVLDAIRQAVKVLGDPTLLHQDMGEHLEISHRSRFQAGVAPDGTPWTPLSPRYQAVKSKNKNKILMHEGRLFNDLHWQADAEGVLLGTNRPYASYHQFGTPAYTIEPRTKKALMWPGGPGPRKKVEHPGLPPRPFLGTSEEDDRRLEEIAMEHMQRALGG